MFIAHAPAGYIISKLKGLRGSRRRIGWFAVITSLVPDLDLLYFYLIDDKANVHHSYWTHTPAFWVLIYVSVLTIGFVFTIRNATYYATLGFACIITHLMLDTVTGGIHWAYPFNLDPISIVNVPSVHGWWVLNFVIHWTFCLELLIVGAAVCIAGISKKSSSM